ncbi:MAG TPA: DUF1572 family protein [Flavisolibacter sp.]
MTIAGEYLDTMTRRLKEYKLLGDRTFEQLNDEELHFRPDPEANSIAIIIRHMHGNMLSRWTNFMSEDGEKPWRRRDDEFEDPATDGASLRQMWNEGWQVFLEALEQIGENDLLKTVTIRNQPLTVLDAINRQVAHYSYHVGQIVYIGRWIRKSEWKSLSIPKNGSQAFNDQMMKTRH